MAKTRKVETIESNREMLCVYKRNESWNRETVTKLLRIGAIWRDGDRWDAGVCSYLSRRRAGVVSAFL